MGGFMSHAIYLPREGIYVAVFYNFRDPARLPEFLAGDLAALAIGKPFNIKETALNENSLPANAQPPTVIYEEGINRNDRHRFWRFAGRYSEYDAELPLR
jgi:hypothetical protein